MPTPAPDGEPAPAGDRLPARPAGSEAALPDGGRRTVVVSPDEVWGVSTASAAAPPSPEAVEREARRSFFGPIVLVVALSAGLMAATLLVLAVGLRFAR